MIPKGYTQNVFVYSLFILDYRKSSANLKHLRLVSLECVQSAGIYHALIRYY